MSRFDRDTDPAAVAKYIAGQATWVAVLGLPKRCKTNEVHPGLACCLFCGADQGEACNLADAMMKERAG